ncbi:MAG TPA: glycosyltransferase family 2 protein [Pirellulales bacterium]|nr:glycosyltransferase family 2 protein [Pirellulales bacterium]
MMHVQESACFEAADQTARRQPSVSVVLSFFNEQEVLPELIQRLRAVLGQQQRSGRIASYELIFVNDASTDHSLEVLLREAAGLDDIRVLNMSRNFGVSPCVLAGMQHASGDAVIYMDADLQDPPEVIPELIRAWTDNPGIEVVHTVRRSRAGESRAKLWLTRCGYWILRQVANVDLRIEAGDFKLLSRCAVTHLVALGEKKPFMRGLVSWIGFPQAEVYYDRSPRFAGKTKFFVCGRKVVRNFLESALISFSDTPLQLATYAGLASSLAAFALLLHVLFEKLAGHNIPGWTAIMTAVLFIGGIQMSLQGMMGLYIGSIYQEVKRRPNYIVASSYGLPNPVGVELTRRSTDLSGQRRPARPHVAANPSRPRSEVAQGG